MCTILSRNLKILKTAVIYLSMLTVGLSISITGPCLLDLQRVVGTDTQHIAFIYTSRSVGYLLGAIIGGILLDIVRTKLPVLTACSFFTAATMLGIPWSKNVNTLLGFFVVNGFSMGALETGLNVLCIELWGSGSFFQALQFLFGVGGLISPLIAAPFLESEINPENSSSNSSILSNGSIASSPVFSTDSIPGGIPNITYPFSIVGGVGSITTTLYVITCLMSSTNNHTTLTDKNRNSNRSCFYMFLTIVFTFFTFFVFMGTEIGFGQTLTIYAVKGRLQTTTAVGSYMTSAFWSSFTIMRLFTVFLSMKISNMILIISDIVLIAIAGMLLLFFMPNLWALWAASVIFGLGVASAYPSLIAWLDDYIEITNKISSIFLVGCAAGEMVVPFIITYYMETIPEIFAYVTAASSVLTTVLLLSLYGIVKNSKKRTSKEFKCEYTNNGIE